MASGLFQLQPHIGCAVSRRLCAEPDGTSDDSIYIIFNMYWETKSFDLPTLPAGKEWHAAIETFDETFHVLPQTAVKQTKRSKNTKLGKQRATVVPPRSIVVFVSR